MKRGRPRKYDPEKTLSYQLRNVPVKIMDQFKAMCREKQVKYNDMFLQIIGSLAKSGFPKNLDTSQVDSLDDSAKALTTIRGIPKKDWKKIKLLCVRHDIHMSSLLRWAIYRSLGRSE